MLPVGNLIENEDRGGGIWENAWNEFILFLDYDVEIRKVICSTNSIESLNARYRRAVKAHVTGVRMEHHRGAAYRADAGLAVRLGEHVTPSVGARA
jgi:hypothetical protein